jgi:UDP-N-acetylmuramoyl-tripeptide--D-alanyl-D-alanine ligase
LKGERTDGHLYLQDIAQSGTLLSLVDIHWFSENQAVVTRLAEDYNMAFLPVADTLSALQDLARFHMGLFPEVTVVGITGSNGKTTTKEILSSILSESFETVANEGNLNSDIGLPLSVFRVEKKHKIAVFEMGMNRVGEMDLLSSIVKPDYAVVTNIGTAHIGPMGSQDAIAQAKKQIFSCFTGKETAIIPETDAYCQFLQKDVNGKVVLYGRNSLPQVQLKSEFSIEGFDLEIDGFPCHFMLPGEFNLANILAAVATAMEIGVPPQSIAQGINKIQPVFGRGELFKGDVTLLRDCYNANPDSMTESLKLLGFWKNRSIAVLGDMLELGNESREQHRLMGIRAAESSAEALFLYGEEMEVAFEALQDSGYSGYAFWTKDFESLKENLMEFMRSGDLVLLKGSRGLALERLTDFIVNK